MAPRQRSDELFGQVRTVQHAYPQIYLACHVNHIRRRPRASDLSSDDASLLAHLSFDPHTTTGTLARHLGVAASSLSARIKHLAIGGYVIRTPGNDRRVICLELTEKGRAASAAMSVLDTAHVATLLEQLSPGDRKRAVGGLVSLATAAARMSRRR